MPYVIRLRTVAFDKAARLAGYTSDYALAQAIGVNRSTISRVRSGALRPSAVFIGGALGVLAPMEFHDLFEVVKTGPGVARAIPPFRR